MTVLLMLEFLEELSLIKNMLEGVRTNWLLITSPLTNWIINENRYKYQVDGLIGTKHTGFVSNSVANGQVVGNS